MNKNNVLQNNSVSEDQLKAEIVSILFRDKLKSFIIALAVAGILLFVLSDNISNKLVTIWSFLMLVSYSIRLFIGYQFSKHQFKFENPQQWINKFRVASLLCGLAWGSVGFYFFPTGQIPHQTFLALVLGGISAGALVNYSVDSLSAKLFVGSALAFVAPFYLFENSNLSKIILLVTIVFVSYMALASKRLAIGLVGNVSLRLEAENQKVEIVKLSERQNLHLENTPVGVIEWDENLTVATWNNACAEIFGYSADEISGAHISYFFPDMKKMSTTNILKTIQEHNSNEGEFLEIAHKNGHTIFCECLNTVLKNEQGELVGLASMVQDKTEFIKTQEKIHQLAYYDTLTGLPNRGLLLDRLSQTLAISDRSNEHAMVAFFDLDHFKALNDIKGHAAGDFLLKTIATRIQGVIRKQDTIARLGGDEFVLVLANVGKTKQKAQAYSAAIMEKISSAIRIPVEYDGYQHQCSASIGVCIFKGSKINGDELLRRADMSMYLAKKQGRNRYQFYDESLQPKYEYQMQLKHDLTFAVANNEFQLYLQGQFNNDSKSIGAEVLLRWKHPKFGMVMPADFIPLAEETGLIVPIGFWVMKQSCALLKKWEASPETRDLTLSVNVSAIQFNNPDFMTHVEVAILASGCDATKLCIELTESAVVNSIEDLNNKMSMLRAMGISLAIDDFGIGYSSLSVLKNLPLNELKIDKSFVQDMANGTVESSIVQTILQMGKNLNLRIVAEGVESDSQLAHLKQYGCSTFQGYFFERPCAVEVFEKALNINYIEPDLLSQKRLQKKDAKFAAAKSSQSIAA
jgi:diguanylate cyclase (GGDEF)-like protein/PAS domain S-box-containing protein